MRLHLWYSAGAERRVVLAMAGIRALSVLAELTGLVFILRSARVLGALRVNSLLGLAGPAALALAALVGLAGLAGLAARPEPWRVALILAGTALVLLGTVVRSGS